MNLNQVTVPALDVAASVAFYRRLGLIQIVDAPHYARFECADGDSTFSVHLAEHVAEPRSHGGSGSVGPRCGASWRRADRAG
jgi:catechol 2,3-dioxygenase-like lactoylglutathione lyase family enzyme